MNTHFIEEAGIDVDLTLVRETQAAMKAMMTNNHQRKGFRRRPDDATVNNAADNSNDISQDISRSSSEEGRENTTEGEIIADLSNNHDSFYAESTSSDASTNLRRSQRSRRPTQTSLSETTAGDGTQSSNDDITTNTSQARQTKSHSNDSQEILNSGVQTLHRPRINETGSKRKVVAAMPPAKRKQGPSRSEKQKERPRQNIAGDIFHLMEIAPRSKKDWWNVKQSSFKSNELLPLDFVEFDKDKNRYQVTSAEDFTEDDVILQAMVIFALYRMEKGWGQARSNKALSIWGGEPANDTDDELFPLVNLWKEEIRQRISKEVIGQNTLNHFDNFDVFPRFYLPEDPRKRWKRRSDSYIGQVHIFAEQAAIQLALHLHEHVSRDYAILSSLIIFTALRDEDDTKEKLAFYLNSLIDSSRKETDCFPKTALDDIFDKSSMP